MTPSRHLQKPASSSWTHNKLAPVPTHHCEDDAFCPPIMLRKEDAISLVNLACSLDDLDFLLPQAFYICSQLPLQELWRGTTSGEKLSSEDIQICLEGKAKLHKAVIDSNKSILTGQLSPSCTSRDSCRDGMIVMVRYSFQQEFFLDADPLFQTGWVGRTREGWAPCRSCAQYHQTCQDDEREETWRNLGGFFGVSSWRDYCQSG